MGRKTRNRDQEGKDKVDEENEKKAEEKIYSSSNQQTYLADLDG